MNKLWGTKMWDYVTSIENDEGKLQAINPEADKRRRKMKAAEESPREQQYSD